MIRWILAWAIYLVGDALWRTLGWWHLAGSLSISLMLASHDIQGASKRGPWTTVDVVDGEIRESL